MEKVTTPKIEEIKNFKKQTTKHYKPDSQTPKNFFVCCFVAIKVQR